MSKDKQLKVIEEVVDEEGNPIEVEIQPSPKQIVPYSEMMEMAKMLSKSTIIPATYQNYPENVIIALDMSNRMGISPMVIMQQSYVVNGQLTFSGQFVATIVNSSKKFREVELVYVGEEGKDSYGAYVTAISNETDKKLKGTTVTVGMAKAEKWGKKWDTMPAQMLGYRAFTFFGRMYCPDELMGMYTQDEMEDVQASKRRVRNPYV